MINEELKEKVDDLANIPQEKLSTWEIDFISDMIDRNEFIGGQISKIEELHERYCK